MSSDTRKNDDGTTVVLIAVEVRASSQVEAQELMAQPSLAGQHVMSWWFAEDDRYDGSDNDSAVFVPMGEQEKWADRVRAERDLTGLPIVTMYDGGLEVANPSVPSQPMFGLVTEESPEENEEDCYDYVLGHWNGNDEWVELQRWPVEWSKP